MEYTVRDMIELLSKYPGDTKLLIEDYDIDDNLKYRRDISVGLKQKDPNDPFEDWIGAFEVGIKTDVKELIFS